MAVLSLAGHDVYATASDRDLLRQYFEERQHQAFAELVRRHQDSAYRVAFAHTGNRAGAEEAVQEAFIRVAGEPGRRALEESGDVRLWFLGVVSNMAKHAFRTERRAERRSKAALGKEVVESPTHDGVDAEVLGRLEGAIGRLSERYRMPIVLHYLEHLSQREIANMMGVSQPSIARRLEEALNLLRVNLLKSGVDYSVAALPALLATTGLLTVSGEFSRTLVENALLNAGAESAASVKMAAMTTGSAKMMVVATVLIVLGVAGTGVVFWSRTPSATAPNIEVPKTLPEAVQLSKGEARQWDFTEQAWDHELPRTAFWNYGFDADLGCKVLTSTSQGSARAFIKLPIRRGPLLVIDVLACQTKRLEFIAPVWCEANRHLKFDYCSLARPVHIQEGKLVPFRFYAHGSNIFFCDPNDLQRPIFIQRYEFTNDGQELALCCGLWRISKISVRAIGEEELPASIRDWEKALPEGLAAQVIESGEINE